MLEGKLYDRRVTGRGRLTDRGVGRQDVAEKGSSIGASGVLIGPLAAHAVPIARETNCDSRYPGFSLAVSPRIVLLQGGYRPREQAPSSATSATTSDLCP